MKKKTSKLLDYAIRSACLRAAHVVAAQQPSPRAFVLEKAALLGKPTRSAAAGCLQPSEPPASPTTKKAYKHRHTRKSDKAAREGGGERKRQENGSPEQRLSAGGVD